MHQYPISQNLKLIRKSGHSVALRRPAEPPLTLAGFATIQRSLLSKTLAFVLVVMLLITNYKLDDYSNLSSVNFPT